MVLPDRYHIGLRDPGNFRPRPVKYLRILQHKSGQQLVQDEMVPPGELGQKLAMGLPSGVKAGLQLMSVLLAPHDPHRLTLTRLFTYDGDDITLPFANGIEFERAVEHFRLLPAVGTWLRMSTTFGRAMSSHRCNADYPDTCCWAVRTLYGSVRERHFKDQPVHETIHEDLITLMFSYNADTNVISGFCRLLSRKTIAYFVHQLRELGGSACHPMLIPATIAYDQLDMFQSATFLLGKRKHDFELHEDVKDDDSVVDRAIMNVLELKAEANKILSDLELASTNLIDPCIQGIRDVQSMLSKSSVDETTKEELLGIGRELEDQLKSFEQEELQLASAVRSMTKSIDDRTQAILTQYAQKDSKHNMTMAHDSRQIARRSVEVAKAARRDSSSMRFIAVLTTLFLPATCVATIFAMPMLEWKAKDFWKYWAISIPLALAVLAALGIYSCILDRMEIARKRRIYKGVMEGLLPEGELDT